MPYQSKLSAVLFQRKYHEDEASRFFLTAKSTLASQQEQLRLLENKLQTTFDALTLKQERGGSPEEISLYFRFIEMFQGKVRQQVKTVLNQEAVCEKRRADLEMAIKERKAVETIEGKREKEYLKEIMKKEQAVLDEIGGQLKLRSHG